MFCCGILEDASQGLRGRSLLVVFSIIPLLTPSIRDTYEVVWFIINAQRWRRRWPGIGIKHLALPAGSYFLIEIQLSSHEARFSLIEHPGEWCRRQWLCLCPETRSPWVPPQPIQCGLECQGVCICPHCLMGPAPNFLPSRSLPGFYPHHLADLCKAQTFQTFLRTAKDTILFPWQIPHTVNCPGPLHSSTQTAFQYPIIGWQNITEAIKSTH